MLTTEEKTFKEWLRNNFSTEQLLCISKKGANTDWALLTDPLKLYQLYRKYDVEIWQRINSYLDEKNQEDDADIEFDNIMSFLTYHYDDAAQDPGAFECACVWAAAQLYAVELTQESKE